MLCQSLEPRERERCWPRSSPGVPGAMQSSSPKRRSSDMCVDLLNMGNYGLAGKCCIVVLCECVCVCNGMGSVESCTITTLEWPR